MILHVIRDIPSKDAHIFRAAARLDRQAVTVAYAYTFLRNVPLYIYSVTDAEGECDPWMDFTSLRHVGGDDYQIIDGDGNVGIANGMDRLFVQREVVHIEPIVGY